MSQSRAMQSTQPILLKIREQLGYKPHVTGLCLGLSMMAIQALFCNEIDLFDERLSVILMLSMKRINVETVIPMLRNDLLAFFDGLEMYQTPDDYSAIFHGDKRPNLQARFVGMPIVQSQKLDADRLCCVEKFSGAYTKKDLLGYFQSLLDTLKNATNPFTWLLKSYNHVVMVSVDPRTQVWTYLDANQFPTQRFHSVKEIADAVHRGFSGEDMLFFSSTVFATESSAALIQSQFANWQATSAWKKIHKVTPEKASHINSKGVNWLNVAVMSEDENTVRELLQKGADVNQAVSGSQEFPLHNAVTQDNVNIFELLLQHHANPNVKTSEGDTPLHFARVFKRTYYIEKLVECGASKRQHAKLRLFSPDSRNTQLTAAPPAARM